MKSEFFIENVKCNGCKNTIIKEARKQNLVASVQVEIESGRVILQYEGGTETLARVKSRLYRKGYPEKGRNNMVSTAKAYVSCAVGRWSKPVAFEAKLMEVEV